MASIHNDISQVMSIAPNPSNVVITINPNGSEKMNVKIYDIRGQIIEERTIYGNSERVDLSKYNKGVYLVLASNVMNSYVGRIVLK